MLSTLLALSNQAQSIASSSPRLIDASSASLITGATIFPLGTSLLLLVDLAASVDCSNLPARRVLSKAGEGGLTRRTGLPAGR